MKLFRRFGKQNKILTTAKNNQLSRGSYAMKFFRHILSRGNPFLKRLPTQTPRKPGKNPKAQSLASPGPNLETTTSTTSTVLIDFVTTSSRNIFIHLFASAGGYISMIGHICMDLSICIAWIYIYIFIYDVYIVTSVL